MYTVNSLVNKLYLKVILCVLIIWYHAISYQIVTMLLYKNEPNAKKVPDKKEKMKQNLFYNQSLFG